MKAECTPSMYIQIITVPKKGQVANLQMGLGDLLESLLISRHRSLSLDKMDALEGRLVLYPAEVPSLPKTILPRFYSPTLLGLICKYTFNMGHHLLRIFGGVYMSTMLFTVKSNFEIYMTF